MADHSTTRVFFVGAGISRDSPSSLESAREITLRLVSELTSSSDLAPYRAVAAEAATNLRLEVLLELLTGVLGPRLVGRVFTPMREAVPNFNHLALAYLGSPVVTTNQDVLLERAARRVKRRPRVLHLHGDCLHPRRIVACLSQYVHGLPPATVADLRELVAGRDLVVLGYSGRDVDVMQVLLQTLPSSVIWVSRGEAELGREVAILEKRLGSQFRHERMSAVAWLNDHLSLADRNAVEALVLTSGPLPGAASPVRRAITCRKRATLTLAIAAVLERGRRVDLAIQLVNGLAQRRQPRHRREPEVSLALGRLWLQQERYDLAISAYRDAEGGALDADARISSLQGQVEALRRSSRYAEAYSTLSEMRSFLGSLKDRPNAEAWAENARAGLLRMEGRALQAHEAYVKAERAFLVAGNLDGVIEARTWRAENRMQVGAVQAGLREAEAAFLDSIDFGRYFTAGWPLFVAGEGLGYTGEFSAAQRQLRQADERFRSGNNASGRAWVQLLSAAFDRPSRLARAQAKLDRAERYLRMAQARGWTWAHVEARLVLEQAELSRAHGDHGRALGLLGDLRELLHRISNDQPVVRIHASLVEAEIRREERDATAVALLTKACVAYRRLGLVGSAARSATAAWLVDPSRPASVGLARVCRRHFPLESHRLTMPDTSYYPIYFV